MIPRIGRWASADPLEIHQPGEGGEFGNAYHYVSGNLLQARDPLGLDLEFIVDYDFGTDGVLEGREVRATHRMITDMRNQLREDFGIATTVTYKGRGGTLQVLGDSEQQAAKERAWARIETHVRRTSRMRHEENTAQSEENRDALIDSLVERSVASAQARWEHNREGYLESLRRDTDVNIDVEDATDNENRSPFIMDGYGTEVTSNPFWYYHVRNGELVESLGGSREAQRRFGPAFMMDHERRHSMGCQFGSNPDHVVHLGI